jgi:hypothetical protein
VNPPLPSQPIPIPVPPSIQQRIHSSIAAARLDQTIRGVSTFPDVNLSNPNPEVNTSIPIPAKRPNEEELLMNFLQAYELPDLANLSIDHIEQVLSKQETDLKAFLVELTPPKKVYVNKRLQQINLDILMLSKLKRAFFGECSC